MPKPLVSLKVIPKTKHVCSIQGNQAIKRYFEELEMFLGRLDNYSWIGVDSFSNFKIFLRHLM